MGISVRPEHLKRYRDIAVLIAKYGRPGLVGEAGLNEVLDDRSGNRHVSKADAAALAADLERLGPTFIKLGQVLSTRYDLLPDAYVDALARLQDDVAPFPFSEVEAIVGAELGLRMSKAFAEFEPAPIAAASLGQVHRARLPDGRRVAVKVQRPNVRQTVADDLDALEEIAGWVDGHTDFGRSHHLLAFVEEFRKSLLRELDYRREAQNLATLARNLEEFSLIVVPRPVDDYTTGRVLTMDYVDGTKITKLSPVVKVELPGRELAAELFRAYLKQILIDGFFHADPHPGNVFITRDHRLALVDLGMVAFVPPQLQSHLTQLVFALSEGRSDDVVAHALQISQRADGFDEPGFERAVADLVALQHGSTLERIEVGKAVLAILRLSGRHGVILAPELGMLGRALLNLDQAGRMLDPQFNPNDAIRDSASEIARRRLAESLSPGKMFQNLIEVKDFAERMPGRVNRILEALADNELEIKVTAFDEDRLMSGMRKIANRITMGLVLAALIVGAAMLMRVPTSFEILGYPGLAIVFFLIAAVGGLALMLRIIRDDRRS